MWKTIGIGRSRSVVFLFFDHDEKAFRDVVSTAHFRQFRIHFFCFCLFFLALYYSLTTVRVHTRGHREI